MRSDAGAACVVVPETSRLSLFPVPASGQVHYLDCGDGSLRAPGLVHRLNEVAIPPESLIGQIHDCLPADRSEHVRRALEALAARYRFDEIHFPLLGGLAFRSLQAKNAGLAFDETDIVVHRDGTSRELREANHSWPAGPDDLILDFMEEYSARTMGCDRANRSALVTVGIAHYNLGRYLPAALQSLAEQTHSQLEVIVIDDGSTQAASIETVQRLERRFPAFQFLRQANAGIGATRNRLLAEARGEYFIPMDADNIAKPEMVATFVRAMERNPGLSAMTCDYLAFNDESAPNQFLYGHRPTGGPHILSCIRNVYGDANGIFRTEDFRAIGGYETDRGTSCEDWEAYVKLIHAGKRIDVVPEYLFHYRHREAGFSRATNWFENHQRVLRQFQDDHSAALLGFQQENLRLREKLNSRHHRLADAIHNRLASPWRWLKRQVG